MLKAIETEYNNLLFRSRLEARWATFFDTMGIKYEYEKEGYDLDGLRYLPDFWLPELKCWVEIKGQEPTEEEHMKCHKLMLHANPWTEEDLFATYKNRRDVFMFVGDIPSPDRNDRTSCYGAYCYSKMYPELSPLPGKGYKDFGWAECPFCHTVGITLRCSMKWLSCECEAMYIRIDAIGAIIADKNGQGPWTYGFCHQGLMGDFVNKMENFLSYHDTPRLIEAYKKARMARFEHRETRKLRQKVDTNLEQVSLLQTKVKKPSSPQKQEESIFKPGDRVLHRDINNNKLGIGVVLASWIEGNTEYVEVQFKSERKRLSMDFAVLEKIQQDQEDMSPPDGGSLTIQQVKDSWPYINRRCKTKKDGAKVAAILNGFDIVGIEADEGYSVVIIQAKANFFYRILSEAYHQAIAEWAMCIELKQQCKLCLLNVKHCLYDQ